MKEADVQAIIFECPEIEADIPNFDERLLTLTDGELVLARAFLFRENLFRTCQVGYRLSPNTLQLAKHLYANTLIGSTAKPIPLELAVCPYEPIAREFPASPTRNGEGERRIDRSLAMYNVALKTLELVPHATVRANSEALKAWDKKLLQSTFAPRPVGRTATAPVPTILKALRNAIEFLLRYGDALVDTLIAVTKEAQDRGSTRTELGEDIQQLISPKLRPLGVIGWATRPGAISPHPPPVTKEQYFLLLRTRPGLWDLLLVLVGACFVIVGVLTARRRGELCELRPGTALDGTGRYLLFFNRKSGPLGLREATGRPIPKIGTRALRLLERMDRGLKELGIAPDGPLFKWPAFFGNGFTKLDPVRPGPVIDRFCDYFEVELDEQGRRYYLRLHQFRRFFAMVFFWYGGFGLMDTLRWFLGHTDVEHLYRYITETTPGAVLRQEKAGYAAKALEHGDQEAEELRRVVLTHFGASTVSVIDQDELKEYIESLIHKGGIAVEPIFLNEASGKTFRVAITVTQRV
jgi:integrase